MPAEDEFRKVAEDVRALARSLRQELRSAQRDARDATKQARSDFRREFQQFKYQRPRPGYYSGWQSPRDRHRSYSDPRPPRSDAPVQTVPRPVRPPKPPAPPKPKRPPYRHKHDGSTLFSILLVMVGLAWLAAQTHIWNISAEAMLAAALAVLGAGMVVTARTDWSLSRRAWPWWVGAGLVIILIGNAANVGDGLSSLSFGPVNFTPATWAEANTKVHNFAGPIVVDLSHMAAPPAGAKDETLTVEDTFGPVTLDVPPNPQFRVHVTTHTVAGPHDSGAKDYGQTGPTLTVNLRTVAGPADVRTTPTPSGASTGASTGPS